jgi:hypothetical protein
MLYISRLTDRLGSVTDGNTICDYDPEEIKRGYSVSAAMAPLLWDGAKINILDTPGFFDFEAEVLETAEKTILSLLPPVGTSDFYRITLVGECDPIDISSLQFPQFPHLQLRDRTVPPTDLWANMGDDNLEGILFRLLHDAWEGGNEQAQEAAKICRRILDGREVSLP